MFVTVYVSGTDETNVCYDSHGVERRAVVVFDLGPASW